MVRCRAGSRKNAFSQVGLRPFSSHAGLLFSRQSYRPLEAPPCSPGPAEPGQRGAFGPSASFTNGASWTGAAAAGFGKG